MVSFHQESQRMAVGTGDNAIVIYDLKTATRWHVLEGHKNTISAVAFSENGKALASYSFVECAVRIWQASSSFLGILSGAQLQCVKVLSVSKSASMNLFLLIFCVYVYLLFYYYVYVYVYVLNIYIYIKEPVPLQMQLQTVKLQWVTPSMLNLFRGWEDPVTFNVDPV